jgi:hypothetical protein
VTKEEVRRQAAESGKPYSDATIDEATRRVNQKFAESRTDVK